MTTCQICGRAIKASKGLIAHHGYTRKSGWQTSSCFGARWRPWEVACDAVPAAISRATAVQAQRKEALVELVRAPPRGLYYQRYATYGHRRSTVGPAMTLLRPDDFDATKKPPGGWGIDDQASYAYQYWRIRQQHEQTITDIGRDIVALRERLKSWKAPEAAA